MGGHMSVGENTAEEDRPDSQILDPMNTKLRRDHSMVGAQILSCIHDILLFDGPYMFVRKCIYGSGNLADSYSLTELTSSLSSCISTTMRWALSFLFVLVIPLFSPWLISKFLVRFNWGYEKHGTQFVLKNLRLDPEILRDSLQANQTVSGAYQDMLANRPPAFLINQKFQGHMNSENIEYLIGGFLLFLLVFFIGLHHCARHNKFLKRYFVVSVLHFLWLSDDFPKLRYTSTTLTIMPGLKVRLFVLVPCAWLATVTSFIVVIPIFSVYAEKDIAILTRVLPNSLFAAWGFGKIYMSLCQATFFLWLSNEKDYCLTQRQFTLQPLFPAMQGHTAMFTVSLAEIEYLASNALMHSVLLNSAEIQKATQNSVTNDHDRFPLDIQDNAWNTLQTDIKVYLKNRCLLKNVYVKDHLSGEAGYVELQVY